MQRNRAPRCSHAFYLGLCVVPNCKHFGGPAASDLPQPVPRTAKASYRGALVMAKALVLEMPDATNAEIAQRCDCSLSLASLARAQLGLRRRPKRQRRRVP